MLLGIEWTCEDAAAAADTVDEVEVDGKWCSRLLGTASGFPCCGRMLLLDKGWMVIESRDEVELVVANVEAISEAKHLSEVSLN